MLVQGKAKKARTSTPLDFYDEWYKDNGKNMRTTQCIGTTHIVLSTLAMVGWCCLNAYNWDCSKQEGESECSYLENWIGSIFGYNIMYCFIFYLNFIAVLIFVCSMNVIRKALHRIVAEGFVKDFNQLRLHFCISLLFLFSYVLIGGLFNLELFGGVNNLLAASPFIMAQAISGIPTLIIQLFMLYVADKVNRFYRDGMNGEEGYDTERFRISVGLRQ